MGKSGKASETSESKREGRKRKRREEDEEMRRMKEKMVEMEKMLMAALDEIANQKESVPRKRVQTDTESDSGSESENSSCGDELETLKAQAEKFLGDDPKDKKEKKLVINEVLVSRINEYLKAGLQKDLKDGIIEGTPRIGEEINLEPPELNGEIAYGLNEAARKRDEHFRESYKMAGTAIACMATAISRFFEEGEAPIDRDEVMQLMANTMMMLGEIMHLNTVARRAFITPAYDKKFKEILEKSDSGKLLFGEKLGERFKEWQSMDKTEAEMMALKRTPFKSQSTNSVNWKRPSRNEAGSMNRKKNFFNSNVSKNKGQFRSNRTYTETQPTSSYHGRSRYYRNDRR